VHDVVELWRQGVVQDDDAALADDRGAAVAREDFPECCCCGDDRVSIAHADAEDIALSAKGNVSSRRVDVEGTSGCFDLAGDNAKSGILVGEFLQELSTRSTRNDLGRGSHQREESVVEWGPGSLTSAPEVEAEGSGLALEVDADREDVDIRDSTGLSLVRTANGIDVAESDGQSFLEIGPCRIDEGNEHHQIAGSDAAVESFGVLGVVL